MRPTTSADKQARLRLYNKQLRDFLRKKSITVVPHGVSGMPTNGTAMPLSRPAVQARVDEAIEREPLGHNCGSVDSVRKRRRKAKKQGGVA